MNKTDSITEINSVKNKLVVAFYDEFNKKHYKVFEGKFKRKYFQFHLDYETILFPPILTSHQEDRIRIYIAKDSSLIINNYTANEGSILIIGAGNSFSSQYVFKKQ